MKIKALIWEVQVIIMIQLNETCNCSPFGNFRTRTFAEIYSSESKFKESFTNSGIPVEIKDTSLRTLYYLLYARYGNSHIASMDENQFKYKLQSVVFMYGPTWEKRLDIQKKLRNLSDNELLVGSQAIYNTAKAPGTDTAGLTDDEGKLSYIDGQSTTAYRKSKLEAYAILYEALETDVTKEFINKFKDLFLKIVEPYSPLWYATKVGELGD